ncbi:MAG: protein kinase, partial [Oscillospiraceae bacterium]
MPTNNIKLCYGCMSPISTEDLVCPQCGYNKNTPHSSDFLPLGTKITGRFITGRVICTDNEGVLYMGLDAQMKIKVWIKEYMPFGISKRNHTNCAITPLSGKEVQYKSFGQGFKDTSMRLKNIQSTAAILPYETVQANNTIYSISKFINTIALSDFLMRGDGELSWATAKKIFMPMLNALSVIHKGGIVHGGISPSSLMLNQNGTLYLGDFSLSEVRLNVDGTNSPEKCYLAPEQFSLSDFQGPWTDIYSMGAVLYKCLTGTMPTDALTRKSGSILPSVVQLGSNVPANVSAAIEAAMSLDKDKRLQSADAFIGRLLESEDSNTAIYTATPKTPTTITSLEDNNVKEALPIQINQNKRQLPATAKYISTITLISFIVIAIAGVGALFLFRDIVFPPPPEPTVEEPVSQIPMVVVPPFEGQYLNAVITNKDYQDKMNFRVEETHNEQYAQGVIYAQDPAPNTQMPDKGTVTLFVSEGS